MTEFPTRDQVALAFAASIPISQELSRGHVRFAYDRADVFLEEMRSQQRNQTFLGLKQQVENARLAKELLAEIDAEETGEKKER